MKYNSEWMLAILEDLSEFCEENNLPNSQKAIEAALIASQEELKKARKKTARPDPADNANRQPSKPK